MADLPINYGDTGKVARDKINDSFNELSATVQAYRPHIEDGIRWIGTTNTGVKAEGDSIVMKVEDGYIWYKSESNSWTKIIAVADLKGPQGNPGVDGNGIASITSTKIGKTTTVTITETDGNVDTFEIQDGEDGTGGGGDVKGPLGATSGNIAVFDGSTGKIIKDGGPVPSYTASDFDVKDLADTTNLRTTWSGKQDAIADLNDIRTGAGKGATAVQPGDIGTAAAKDTGTSSGNVPVLDANGKLATTTLPGVALTDTFTVSTSSDLTSLSSAEQGDLAIVTTESKTYVLSADPYSTAANWKEIISPTGGVTSVNGNTGAVTVSEFTPGGTATTGYVVTKTNDGYSWSAPSGGDVLVSDQAGNIFTSGMKIWGGTTTDYESLTPDSNTAYLLLADQPTPPSPSYTITGSTTVGSFTPGSFSDLQGFFMSPDGENAYITFWDGGNGKMAQYSLSTPWDISTASQTQYISLTKPNGFCFSNDGTYMFYSTEDGMNIVRYSLSTPWDISTASQDSGQVLNVDSTHFAINVCLSDDGDYIWFGVDSLYNIVQYELTTPFDLTTATNQKVLNISESASAVMVKNDGKYMYKTKSGPVKQYELATPYDITSTATEIGSYSLTVGEHRCLFVSNDCKYWAIGNNSGGITQFEAQPIS